jgi:diaminohydroxyphosphoribosylaminopyrimidine deaminase/5-amino-6-(5-phosphoribosylamino)uracil reductase
LVETGLLAEEATQINEAYLHFMRTGRPFVHLKLAVSLDGKIATRTGDSRWITGPEARCRAHELRHAYDAILVGAGTVAYDDPSLTDRSGLKRRRRLLRVVLDDKGRLAPESKLATTSAEAPVLLVARAGNTDLTGRGVEIVPSNPSDLYAVLAELGRRSIQSVLVEGGGQVAGSFIEAALVNKVTFFIAPKIIGGGSSLGWRGIERMSEAFELERVEVTQRGRDIEVTGYPAGQTT